jgi:hypothetical protein
MSCQLDQSVNLIKEKLFANEEKVDSYKEKKPQDLEKEIQVSEDIAQKDREISRDSLDNLNIPRDQQEETKDDTNTSSIPEGSLSPRSIKNNKELAFKEMGKARDKDSKIVSFFTKIFEPHADDKRDFYLEPPVTLKNQGEKRRQKLEEDQKIVLDEEQELTFGKQQDLRKLDEESNEKMLTEDNYTSKDQEEIENKKKSFAFLQPKLPLSPKPPASKGEKKILETDNAVGLLLPLTGKKRSAGSLVLNALRYSMALRPNNLNFKIYDTKGNLVGVKEAAQKGINDGVLTFIGPIFSDETRELKEFFQNNKELTFFSLSPDFSNVSENVIVSGQNPEDQISCITQHLSQSYNEKVLLIHHSDTYGYIIKDSLTKFLRNFGFSNIIALDSFEIGSKTDINKELKRISEFERRKLQLENEILSIKKDEHKEAAKKKKILRKLERQLTLDSPFDSVIVASEGDKLLEILSHLAFYDINSENTNIYGTSLWEDTIKKDNVFEGAFYVTSLKNKSEDFVKNFKDVFSRDPLSFNFHMYDLINFVQKYKFTEGYDKEKQVFYGEFSNSKIKSGLLKRETYIKKIKKNERIEEVFTCHLDVI